MTKLQRLIRRPADERGFTLIELLVVIIILGILAAVVVFAVSGVGDKGKSSAVAIDARTLRTAEEAYCAQNGRYADGSTLVAEGFLSDEPEYHSVGAQNTGFGTCNGWTYSVLPTSAADADSGKWTLANTSPYGQGALKRLPDGRVVHLACNDQFCGGGGTATAIWDPDDGQWTTGDSTSSNPTGAAATKYAFSVVLTENCGSNCGKIFVDMEQGWHLFDPDALPGTQWENLGTTPYSNFTFNIQRLFQFADVPSTPVNECGANCGKVLIITSEQVGAQLYDPEVSGPAAFTSFSYGTFPGSSLDDSMLLPDGRVLLVGRAPMGVQAAALMDPVTLQLSTAGTPLFIHNAGVGAPMVLPNGEVLVAGSSNSGTILDWEIYTPQPGGPGSWRQPASPTGCFTPPAPARRCSPMVSLPDGRVLASGATEDSPMEPGVQTVSAWLFDPTTEAWSQTADKPAARLLFSVLLDPRTGPCGAYCNKVLTHYGLPGFIPSVTAYYTP